MASISVCTTTYEADFEASRANELPDIQRSAKANYFAKAKLINDRVPLTLLLSLFYAFVPGKLGEVASSQGDQGAELCLEGSRSSFDREMAEAKAPKTPTARPFPVKAGFRKEQK